MAKSGAGFLEDPDDYVYRGIRYNRKFHPHIDIKMFDPWKVEPSDVLIATYPKSGTTWMGAILSLLFETTQGDVEFKGLPYMEMGIPGLSPPAIEVIDQLPRPRLLKTHMSYEFFKDKVENENLKVIVVMRNPKDTLTSFYYMHKQEGILGFKGEFSDFFKCFQAKKLGGGDVFQWNLDWWEKRDLPNVLIVKYEDMKKDCAAEIQRVCGFLEKDVDPLTIEKIVHMTSFKKMKEMNLFEEMPTVPGGIKIDNDMFFRKGGIGDWKNHFTDEEAKYVDDLSKQLFEPAGLTFDV